MIISENERKEIEKLVRQAGAKLMDYWPGSKSSALGDKLKIESKKDGSSVTSADFASNEILLAGLKEGWPEYGIISEECPDQVETRKKQKVWIIDPLDGTRSFINSRDDFSVLVGLSCDNLAKFGAMFFPVTNIYAVGEEGKGAFQNASPLKVSGNSTLRKNSIYYRNFEPPKHECFFNEYMDSGLAFLALCRGEFDGMIIRMSSHKEWDIAAPLIIAQESGARVTDENNKPIKFNTGTFDYRYIVASNGHLHDQLLSFIPR